jgi:hypothetical protein
MTNTKLPCIWRDGCNQHDACQAAECCQAIRSNREKQSKLPPSKELDVQPVMWLVFEYARIMDGSGALVGEERAERVRKAHLKDEEIRNAIRSLVASTHEPCSECGGTKMTLADRGNFEPTLGPCPRCSTQPPFDDPFQDRVARWMQATFDAETVSNKTERNHRFLEESLELVQSLGCTQAEAHMLVDYVFGRPVGECEQETGGVMVTLAALANASNIRVNRAAETELTRCWSKIEQIRGKQAGKPKHSPLPGPTLTKCEGCEKGWEFDSEVGAHQDPSSSRSVKCTGSRVKS